MLDREEETKASSADFGNHIVEGSFQPESHLKRLDRVEDIGECRDGSWSYPGLIGVIDVMVTAVEQVQELGGETPIFVDAIPNLPID